jgi:hypothetical protein
MGSPGQKPPSERRAQESTAPLWAEDRSRKKKPDTRLTGIHVGVHWRKCAIEPKKSGEAMIFEDYRLLMSHVFNNRHPKNAVILPELIVVLRRELVR